MGKKNKFVPLIALNFTHNVPSFRNGKGCIKSKTNL